MGNGSRKFFHSLLIEPGAGLKRIDFYMFYEDEGCSAMRIYGRKGWERVLDDYDIAHVVLEKAL